MKEEEIRKIIEEVLSTSLPLMIDQNPDIPMWNENYVAEVTTLSLSTLRKMRHFGKGPAYHKIGGRVVYSPEDVLAYIRSKRIVPNKEVMR